MTAGRRRWARLQDEVFRPAITERAPVLLHSPGLSQDGISDLGEVLHVTDLVALRFEKAKECIRHRIGKCMAQVCRRIECDPADIDGKGGLCRYEGLNTAREGIMELELQRRKLRLRAQGISPLGRLRL